MQRMLAVLLVSGCASGAVPTAQGVPAQSAYPLTVRDDVQRQVTVEKKAQRIVSLAPSNTELVYALGLQDALVGVDDYSNFPAEAAEKEKIGGYSKPNMEKIVALSPDLVLATYIHVKTVVPELEKRGLVVVVLQPATLEGVLDDLTLLGKIGGVSQQAEKLVGELKTRIEAVTTKTKGRVGA